MDIQGDAGRIYKWLDKYDWREHPDANRVVWMLNLMEEAGVPIED